jgi:hypothetical protein
VTDAGGLSGSATVTVLDGGAPPSAAPSVGSARQVVPARGGEPHAPAQAGPDWFFGEIVARRRKDSALLRE